MNNLSVIKNGMSEQEIFLTAGFQQLSKHTQTAYTQDMNKFYSIVNKDIRQVNSLDVIQYVKTMTEDGASNNSINRRIASLSKILNMYKLTGYITKNPVSEINKVKKLTRPVSTAVSVPLTYYDVKKVLIKTNRITTIINVLVNTGLRISELINIKNSDVQDYRYKNNDFKKIRIVGKGNKERPIYITLELYNQIKQIFNQENKYLFFSKSGKLLNQVNLYKQIKQCFKVHTGLTNIHPHTLRHYFATQKISVEKKDLKSVSKYLGHSSTAITLDMYVDTALQPDEAMIETII